MRLKRFVLVLLAAIVSMEVGAQTLDSLTNVCYTALEHDDTVAFEQTYPSLYDAYLREYDELYHVIRTLKEVHDSDQSIRILLSDIYKDMDGKGKYLPKVRQMMSNIDNRNVSIVTQIIDKYGWLGKGEIGEEANETLFLCIQHCQDSLIQHKYLPIIKEAVSKGSAEPWHFAFLTDRVRMNGGQPQIYGTQTIKANGRTYPVPLQDPFTVDDMRLEIGLEPLDDYMQGFGERFTVDEYQKEEPTIKRCFEHWLEKNRQNRNN